MSIENIIFPELAAAVDAFLLLTIVDPENKNVIRQRRQQRLETPQGLSAATLIPNGDLYNCFLLTFIEETDDLDQNFWI